MNAMSRQSILSVIVPFAFAAMIALLGLIVCPGSAYAVPRLDTAGTQVVVYYPKYESYENTYVLKAPKGEEDLSSNLTKCVSSNKGVLDYRYIFSNSIELEVKKAGTATLTCVYKEKEYKIKYVVKKYVNPVKTLKIGKKNYAKKFKKSHYLSGCSYPIKGKLNVVAAKNWKLKTMRLSYYDKEGGYCEKNVKNGKKIYGLSLSLTFKNKKTKAVETINVDAEDIMD